MSHIYVSDILVVNHKINDMIYHEDAAQRLVKACLAENLSHRIFHLGTWQGVTLKDTIKVLEYVYGDIDVRAY